MIRDDLRAKAGFTAVESQVADFILAHQEGIEGLSARAIAREIHTAPSSIVRLCQRLGYQGYQDFRLAWLEEVRYLTSAFSDIDANRPFRADDDVRTVAARIGSLYLETVQDTLRLVSTEDLSRATHAVVEAGRIVLVSVGSQGDVAADFADKMLHIGRVISLSKTPDNAYYLARTLGPGDVLIALSYSGETAACLRASAVARAQRAQVLAITSFGRNRLADLATWTLRVSTRERLVEKVGSYAMTLSSLLLLDILYSEVFNVAHAANMQRRTTLGHDYERRRDSSNPILRDRWHQDAP